MNLDNPWIVDCPGHKACNPALSRQSMNIDPVPSHRLLLNPRIEQNLMVLLV